MKYPFKKVNIGEIAFGAKVDYNKLYDDCPDEYKNENKFSDLFSEWFFNGLSEEKAKQLKFIDKNENKSKEQVYFLMSIMKSFEPKHEQKEAICCWLMSMIFAVD